MQHDKRKKRLRVLLLAAVPVVLIAFSFFLYVSDYYRAGDVAAVALKNGTVAVSQESSYLLFQPSGSKPKAGLIFYPGGKVEYTAYAPLMRAIAERGYACVLVKMPFNLAVFDANAANKIIDAYPKIEIWFVGGHSLGGSMAAAWCADNTDRCGGLVLLGSYSASDLVQSGLPVLVITGSKDGVLNREKFESSKANLPAGAQVLVIDGGNHAQFGSYGPQKGDGVAEVSEATQQTMTAEAIEAFLAQSLN